MALRETVISTPKKNVKRLGGSAWKTLVRSGLRRASSQAGSLLRGRGLSLTANVSQAFAFVLGEGGQKLVGVRGGAPGLLRCPVGGGRGDYLPSDIASFLVSQRFDLMAERAGAADWNGKNLVVSF